MKMSMLLQQLASYEGTRATSSRLSVRWLNGKLLRRRHLSHLQLEIFATLMPIVRGIDSLWPWSGLSLIGASVKR
jgi:hypothetical protein